MQIGGMHVYAEIMDPGFCILIYAGKMGRIERKDARAVNKHHDA